MHASGVLADATFSNQSLQTLRRVFASKTNSAQNLHGNMQQAPLAFEVLFSSVTALLGGMGQANYAAANAALDSMAAQWQSQGRGGVSSIQWGGWAGGGMAGADPTTAARLARMGMPLIQPHQGLAVLGGMLRTALPPAQLTMVPFDWPKFLSSSSQAASVGMFDNFTHHGKSGNHPQQMQSSITSSTSSSNSSSATANADNIAALPEEARLAHLTSQVVMAVTSVLGSAVSASEPLMASGLDSLGAVELKNALEAQVGLELPSTLTFDYPTIDALADYINSIIPAAQPTGATHTVTAAPAAQPIPPAVQNDLSMHSMRSGSLAVVTGAASRSVKDAISGMHGVDTIIPVPLSHWDVEPTPGGSQSSSSSMAARFGGFLDQLAMFDGSLFGLPASEAQLMDPQQRMLLELTYQVMG